MKGELVIVKDAVGRPLLRRVWDATAEVVFVASQRCFDDLLAGKVAATPIGFPRGDVYSAPDGKVPKKLDWRCLRPWKG